MSLKYNLYIKWDNTNGWMESDVIIKENEFILGEIYFENENYQLIAVDKKYNTYYLEAVWKY